MMDERIEGGKASFKATVEVVRFANKDTGYHILVVQPDEGEDVIGRTIVTCIMHETRKGDKLEINGTWTYHQKYGWQVKGEFIKVILPETYTGVLDLLMKGYLEGVGPVTAKRLVDKFGVDIFRVIEKNPMKLKDVKGITKKNLEKIIRSYKEKQYLRGILEFCAIHNIPSGQGYRIYEVYGESAVNILSRNPYLLTDSTHGIKGIGFKKADAIALSLGLPKDSDDRLLHGIEYYLRELTIKKGGCAVQREELVVTVATELSLEITLCDDFVTKMLNEKEPRKKRIVEDTIDDEKYVWTKVLYEKEKEIANKIISIKNCKQTTTNRPKNIDSAIAEAEEANNITLADSQKEAIKNTLSSNFSVITGGPGVGKTTIIRCILYILSKYHNTVALAAPTGKASKRMQEATGKPASTIHRLLGTAKMVKDDEEEENEEVGDKEEYKVVRNKLFLHDETDPLTDDVFIIDESSMIDTSLMHSLLRAIPDSSMVILVGDVDQLPSVGLGKILEDIINSNTVKVSRLTTIFRQAQSSKIITSAHAVNHGKVPELDKNSPEDDFHFIERNDMNNCLEMILKLVDYIPKRYGCDPLWDVQVLSPKKASDVGTENLNMILQMYYHPDVKLFRDQERIKEKENKNEPLTPEERFYKQCEVKTPVAKRGFKIFTEGDKVMQIKNNYKKDVFNGDVGIIEKLDPEVTEGDDFALVKFPDNETNRYVKYSKKDLFDEIVLSYACTIHKSQGSEYPYLIIPMMPTFSIMLQRKLLYTGITRGKKHVCIVGNRESLKQAVHDHYRKIVSVRKTKLKYWLKYVNKHGRLTTDYIADDNFDFGDDD